MKKLIPSLAVILSSMAFTNCQSDSANVAITDDAEIDWKADQPVPKAVIQSTRAFRERLLADPYRPAYHFCVPEDRGIPGDPNGAFYYNGRYHLMYLYNREGSGFAWGHISSKDLLHWRHHPDAIGPGNREDGVFSGGAFVDQQGKAILTYWQYVNDWRNESAFSEGEFGIGIAESVDEHFDNWTKSSSNPVIPSTDWGITVTKDQDGQ